MVTGGGTGIGYAVAAAFAAQGERVTVAGRREQVLSEAAMLLGANPVPFDAADPAAVERALADLPERIDVLVNNAGGNTDFQSGPATDLTSFAANWQADLNANVFSAVLVTRAPRDADRQHADETRR